MIRNINYISKNRNYPSFTREVYQKYSRDELFAFFSIKLELLRVIYSLYVLGYEFCE